MTATVPETSSPFKVHGWILWLTWLYVGIFALGTLFGLLWRFTDIKPFGLEFPAQFQITVWWVLAQIPNVSFAIGCAGVLLGDRDFAWVAVVSAWAIVGVQCVQAFLQLFHLRLSLPVSAVVYAAYAIGLANRLRPKRRAIHTSGGLSD